MGRFLLWAALIASATALKEWDNEEATDETWDAAVASTPLILAGFFAPW
jgi:hypothetical protein